MRCSVRTPAASSATSATSMSTTLSGTSLPGRDMRARKAQDAGLRHTARVIRRLAVVVGVVLTVVALLVGGLWLFQRELVYVPSPGPVPPAATAVARGQDVVLTTADDVRLGAWFVPGDRCATGRDGAGGERERRRPLDAGAPGGGAERPGPRRAALRLPRLRRQPGEPERGGPVRRRPRRAGPPRPRPRRPGGPDALPRREPGLGGRRPPRDRVTGRRHGPALAVGRPPRRRRAHLPATSRCARC